MKKLFAVLLSLSIVFLFGCSANNSTENNYVGDWNYKGVVDNNNYEISLDLESNSNFSMEVEESNAVEKVDSELQGTYVTDGDIITLSIITVKDENGYFNNEVVQNGQIELKYSQTEDTLTLDNANSTILFLPGELVLNRD